MNNKGIRRVRKKRVNNLIRSTTVKEEQEKTLRFIEFNYDKIERVNGKYKYVGKGTDKGLQVRNRVYMSNGTYKLVNSKGLRVTNNIEGVPEWAADILIERYNKELLKLQKEEQA